MYYADRARRSRRTVARNKKAVMELGEITQQEAIQLVHRMDTDATGGNTNKLYVEKMMSLLNSLSYSSWLQMIKPASTNLNMILDNWDTAMASTGCDAVVAVTIPFTNTGTEESPSWLGASLFLYGGMYNNIDSYLTLAWNESEHSSGISAVNSTGTRVMLSTNGVTHNVNGSYTISQSYRNLTDFEITFYRNFVVDDETVSVTMQLPFSPFVRGTWRKACNISLS